MHRTSLPLFLSLLGALGCSASAPRLSSPSAGREPARRPALVLPFRLRDRGGEASFYYEADHDPARWGFGLLNLPFPIEQTKGFPLFEGRIRYDGVGYRSVMGWIQLVTNEPPGEAPTTSVDQIPLLRGQDIPFESLGPSPTTFAAPGPNPPRTNETWTAYTFLAICPDVGRTRKVGAILGVRWGHVLVDGKATLQPLARVDEATWERMAVVLRTAYPHWEFMPGMHDR